MTLLLKPGEPFPDEGPVVRTAGLFRCCVEEALQVVGSPGARLTCRHCAGEMRFRDGAWEWDRYPLPEQESKT